MRKINYLQFKATLTAVGKTYFSRYDLKKFYPGDEASLKVLLSNWARKKLICNLGKSYYAFSLLGVDFLRLANELDPTAYISFEYALYYHNLIDQVPAIITLATKKRSRTIKCGNWVFEYTHLKDDLHFGYELKDKVYIASPEKALSDILYLLARGKRLAELDTLEIKKINKKKLKDILKKYPQYTIKLLTSLYQH